MEVYFETLILNVRCQTKSSNLKSNGRLQILYLFSQSFLYISETDLSTHTRARAHARTHTYIYICDIYSYVCISYGVSRGSHSPTFEPFYPLNYLAFPSSFLRFLTAVPSVERVINRATRWCCNMVLKALLCACTLRSNARKPLKPFDIDHAGHVTWSAKLAISSLSRSWLAELWSRKLHVPLTWIYQG